MYWKVGEFLSKETEHASYGDAWHLGTGKKNISEFSRRQPQIFRQIQYEINEIS